jgi:high-affinity iron transporter
VLLGIAIATVLLVGLVLIVGRIGRKLNPRPVMLASSILLAVLSVSLTGHGLHALQEGGYLRMSMVMLGERAWSGISFLGIYPTWQGLLGQLAVVALLLFPSLLERLRSSRPSSTPPSGSDTQPSRA